MAKISTGHSEGNIFIPFLTLVSSARQDSINASEINEISNFSYSHKIFDIIVTAKKNLEERTGLEKRESKTLLSLRQEDNLLQVNKPD